MEERKKIREGRTDVCDWTRKTAKAFGNARSVQSVALDGRDGYDGLSAFLVLETAADAAGPIWDIEGVIVSSALPDAPEPDAAE